MQLEVKNWHLVLHLSMDDFHRAAYSGKIVRPNSVLHGKELYKEIETPIKNGEFGEAVIKLWIDDEEEEFETIEELLNYYENLT